MRVEGISSDTTRANAALAAQTRPVQTPPAPKQAVPVKDADGDHDHDVGTKGGLLDIDA